MDGNQRKNKSEILKKIGILAIIVVLVLGVWLYKNMLQSSEGISEIEQQDKKESETVDLSSIEGYFPLHVIEEIDLEKLKSYGLPIVIDFGADSCIPCKEMAPVLEKLNTELAGKAIILFVDVWKYPELVKNYPIEVIPTQILINSKGDPYVAGEDITLEFIHYKYKDTNEHAFTAHQGGLTEEQLLLILKEMGLEE